MSQRNDRPPVLADVWYSECTVVRVEGDPNVLVKGAIVVVKDGVEYPIDAEFDIGDVPEEVHETLMQVLGRIRQRVHWKI